MYDCAALHGEPPILRRHANSVSPSCGVRSSFVRTADFGGLYTATGGAEFGPLPLGGPCGPPRTLRHAPEPLTRRWSSILVVLQFRCRRVKTIFKITLQFRYYRVLSKALLGFSVPDNQPSMTAHYTRELLAHEHVSADQPM